MKMMENDERWWKCMLKNVENKALATVKPCRIAEIVIPQIPQNVPNLHPGLCRTKLDKCREKHVMQHATAATAHFCLVLSKKSVHKTRTSKYVKTSDANRAFVTRDPMPPTIPLCGLGHGMVMVTGVTGRERIRGFPHRADMIWLFLNLRRLFVATFPAN